VEENDPVVLRYAAKRQLGIGGQDFGANLERFLARAATVESSSEMVTSLGRAIGNAYLRGRGPVSAHEGVRQLSDLFRRVQAP
jgi:hypothetical protein